MGAEITAIHVIDRAVRVELKKRKRREKKKRRETRKIY